MSTRSRQIPSECIQLILQHLVHDHALSTLANMLLVSRHMFSLTVPILYSDPFRYFQDPEEWSAESFAQLIRLFTATTTSTTSTIGFKYVIDTLLEWDESEETPLEEEQSECQGQLSSLGMLEDYRLHLRHLDFEGAALDFVLDECLSSATHHSELSSVRYRTTDLRMELTRAIVDQVAERLWSLTIPLWDIGWYLSRIHRFKSLKNVRFQEFEEIELRNVSVEACKASIQSFPFEKRDNLLWSLFDAQFYFVKEHLSIFKGVLKGTESFYLNVNGVVWRKLPDILAIDLAKLFPPLKNPSYLDEFTVFHFLAHADETNLEFLESIDAFPHLDPELQAVFKTMAPFLPRCRRLKSLQWRGANIDLFRWAVEERKRWDESIQERRNDSDTLLNQLGVLDNKGSMRPSLVPVESIVLLSPYFTFNHMVDDILYAFSDSLKTLRFTNVHLPAEKDTSVHLHTQMFIGNGMTRQLPRLQELSVDQPTALSVWLRPEVLDGSPLYKLHIDSFYSSNDGSIADIPDTWIKPVKLNKLKELYLRGSPSTTFHLDTLHSTKELENIDLSMDLWSGSFDTSSEVAPGLLLRQHEILKDISWNWHLPRLKSLSLNSMFAYYFQFRMLSQCPLLEELSLGIREERTLSVLELKTPKVDVNCNTVDGAKTSGVDGAGAASVLATPENGDFISTPRLSSLALGGPWIISVETWRALTKDVAPKIFILNTTTSKGYKLREFVDLTREMTRLKWVWVGDKNRFPDGTEETLGDLDSNETFSDEDQIKYTFQSSRMRVKRQSPVPQSPSA